MFGEIQTCHALDLVKPIGDGLLVRSQFLGGRLLRTIACKEHAQGLQQGLALRAVLFQQFSQGLADEALEIGPVADT